MADIAVSLYCDDPTCERCISQGRPEGYQNEVLDERFFTNETDGYWAHEWPMWCRVCQGPCKHA